MKQSVDYIFHNLLKNKTMVLNFFIFLVINCLGFQNEPNAFDLLMFGLGSFILISVLGFYYNRIPKSSNIKSELDNPIYQIKDILLHSNSNNASFVIAEKTTSSWVKFFVFCLITFLIFTPLQQLFGV